MSKETSEPSVLVIGEALMDLVIGWGKDDDAPDAVPGGSAANVALAMGRLGLDVELTTWLGQDSFGDQIRKHLTASNVAISSGSDGASATSTAEARLDEHGAATYNFEFEWAPVPPIRVPASAKVVHTGSIASVLSPGSDTVLEALHSAHDHAIVTYDPNVRPAIMGTAEAARGIVEAFVKETNLVKVSDEDLEWLYPDIPAEIAAQNWLSDFSLSAIVLTRGKKGPIAWAAGGAEAAVTPKKVTVVDTVGAGDTFMGGLIDSLYRRGLVGEFGAQKIASLTSPELQEILSDASAVADIVVQRRGANPPWASEIGR